MKLGYFVTKFPYGQQIENYPCGGSSLAAYYLANEMKKGGHDIHVFTTSVSSKECIVKDENITIHRYGTNFRMLTTNISFGLFIKPTKHDVDIAHVHFDIPPGPMAGFRYVKKKNVPLIITYHGDWDESYGGPLRRIGVAFHNRYLVDKLLSYSDIIISPSEYYVSRSLYLKKYKYKVVVIPNGINLRDFNIPYSKDMCREKLGLQINKKIVLFFGYLSPYKGPDILVKAMPKILKYVPNVEVIFAGKGAMRDELKMLSRSLDVESNIKFVGFIEDDLKPFYYKASDVYVLPSNMKTECYPLTILEAMACGVPIVASDTGGIPDAVKNGENGLLTPPNDPEALADAIIYFLENEDIREKMGENGKKKVEIHLWERIAKETEEIYYDLLSR